MAFISRSFKTTPANAVCESLRAVLLLCLSEIVRWVVSEVIYTCIYVYVYKYTDIYVWVYIYIYTYIHDVKCVFILAMHQRGIIKPLLQGHVHNVRY